VRELIVVMESSSKAKQTSRQQMAPLWRIHDVEESGDARLAVWKPVTTGQLLM
jgi:hypothetical protein